MSLGHIPLLVWQDCKSSMHSPFSSTKSMFTYFPASKRLTWRLIWPYYSETKPDFQPLSVLMKLLYLWKFSSWNLLLVGFTSVPRTWLNGGYGWWNNEPSISYLPSLFLSCFSFLIRVLTPEPVSFLYTLPVGREAHMGIQGHSQRIPSSSVCSDIKFPDKNFLRRCSLNFHLLFLMKVSASSFLTSVI